MIHQIIQNLAINNNINLMDHLYNPNDIVDGDNEDDFDQVYSEESDDVLQEEHEEMN